MKNTKKDVIKKANWLDNLKSRAKRYPKLYYFIIHYMSPVLSFGKPLDTIVPLIENGDPIINIGSGAKKISPRIINIDIMPYKNVDITANVSQLPLRDNSVGGIINIAMLEHIEAPHSAIKEMHRVLKPGGYIHILVPFIYGFHASPHDYYRWTDDGIRKVLDSFEEIELDVATGPTSALLLIFQEWLAMFFSLRNRFLYRIFWFTFQLLLTPFKIIDFYLIKHPEARNISATFYFIGRKLNEK